MKSILAGTFLLLLVAAPAVPKSATSQCKSRCSVNYGLCLKRTTTAKGQAGCKAERKMCKRTCNPPSHH